MSRRHHDAVCPDCGQTVPVDVEGILAAHTRPGPWCPGSGTYDMTEANTEGGPWEVSGGLPTLGKHHR